MGEIEVCVYHNPRCSKSRRVMEILEASGHRPRAFSYLEERLSLSRLRRLMQCLGIEDPRQMLRRNEAACAERRLDDCSAEEVLAAVLAEPVLLQRPIVVAGERALIARPPEQVEAWLADGAQYS